MVHNAEPNILIIGNLHSHPSSDAFLKKFLKIIGSLSNEVCIISGDKPTYDNIQWIKYEKHIHNGSLFKRAINFIKSQLWLVKTILNLNFSYDIVLILPTAFLVPNLLLKFKKKKVGLFVAQKSDKFFTLISKINFIFSDLIIVESENVIKDWNISRRNNILKGNMYVDKDLFQKVTEFDHRQNIVGYVGRLSTDKGVLNFIEAIPLILRECPEIKFLIVGEGPLYEIINKKLTEMNLRENVKMEGWIDHCNLSYILNKLKLFVLPSYTEGLPNIVLEAMASGTPVLVSSVGGIPNLIKNNKNGIILKENSPSCIAYNVINSLKNIKLNKISKNALKTIEKDYYYENSVKRWEHIIEFLNNL